MTNYEYAKLVLEVKKETATSETVDEASAYESAQLISAKRRQKLSLVCWVTADFAAVRIL